MCIHFSCISLHMLNRNTKPMLLWASMIYAWYNGRVRSLAHWSQASLRFHQASVRETYESADNNTTERKQGYIFELFFFQRSISEVSQCILCLYSAFYVRWKQKINSKRSTLSLVLFLLFISCLAFPWRSLSLYTERADLVSCLLCVFSKTGYIKINQIGQTVVLFGEY